MKITRGFGLGLMVACVLVLVAACMPISAPMAGAEQEAAEMEMAAPEPVAGELTIVDAFARPVPIADGNSAIYLTVLNGLDEEVTLASAATDIAQTVELHETQNDEGIMRMVPQPDGFAVPAGGAVMLQPGGKHVMLLHVAQPLAVGDEIDVALNFSNGTTLELTVPVAEPSSGGMNMGN